MATNQKPSEVKSVNGDRRYSVNISIFVGDISREQADKLEDAIRDAADDFGANVNVSRSNPLPQ